MCAGPPKNIAVTAALIPCQDRIFIAQRPPHKKFGLLWEFPGGKVETGESLQSSLIREIDEELCWKIQVGEFYQHVQCRFQGFSVDLYAFWCTIEGGSLCLREHVAYHWACLDELSRFDFTLADRRLVSSLGRLRAIPHGGVATSYFS
ncbi:MAG: (deoxy)nucleoside triphosphate pyrophosphohydrolase [Deltaproteobacteria bacterium]|nr:(deoxy)nucleoside triphosphate pyrophosphohydrolase [Deltaproteobacteria bacterium]